MKRCFKCETEKPIEEFYPHPTMRDGHLNKCKDCTKADEHQHRKTHRAQIRDYERERFQRPERKADAKANLQRYRKANPEKNRARARVSYALRKGKLKRLPCEVCGQRAQAHHDDYSKPLEVRWLCFRHHREHHGQEVTF